ncbi:MAG TPA: hypothetical protein P5218_16685, partial [Planctomycetota bacterium]|nr:hypothetical protein [Planctomycetota bacterium]
MEIHQHDSAEHGPHSEDFPRLELARLVGEAQRQARVRQRVQMALMGLGLFLMALGLPNERYFRSMDRLWQLAGSGPPPQGVLTLPIYALHGMGLSLEAAVFLVNALLYGASLWALQRMLRVVGFAWNLAWVSSLVALTCPVAWLGATLPTDYAAGVLGAALLATELFQTKQNKAFGYLWRVSIWL